MHARALATAALLMLSVSANAALYRWVDERGVVHFSDQPPPRHIAGETAPLSVPKPATGTVPLTSTIPQRSRSLSASSVGKTHKDRRAARKSARSTRSSSTRRSNRAPYSARSTPSKRIRANY